MAIAWQSNIDQALADAGTRNMPVLVDVSAAPH
jgi:hypothetical protein